MKTKKLAKKMNCIYCQTGEITIRPTWEGVEAGCRELLARQARGAASPPPCRLEGKPR